MPQLIKQSSTYKLFVPKKVEEKIRYLIRKFPSTEWSGVLFYTHTGSFENNDLEIHCEDLYPMDLGTGGWTEFKMTEDVTAYIVENMELFNCETGLIHSHHHMGAFFSGQDTKTLNIEGNDTNCFVSLIVDTRGTYQAAITRKVSYEETIETRRRIPSYEFFGEGKVALEGGNEPYHVVTRNISTIEYFMLDVQREETNNPLDYLDARFEEIEAKKAQAAKDASQSRVFLNNINNNTREDLEDKEFYSWIHSERNKANESKEAGYSQPSLFGEEVMEELVDPTKWQPDPTIIHYLVCQLLTSSLIVNKDIDLKQWVKVHMEKKYDQIFSGADKMEFTTWADALVEFIVNHYSDANIPEEVYDDWDTYQSKIAAAILDEIGEYPSNDYLEAYAAVLNNYIMIEI